MRGLLRSEYCIKRESSAVERLRFEIDPGWQGDIPRTMLISREGTITTIEGSAEMADVERWSDQQRAATK